MKYSLATTAILGAVSNVAAQAGCNNDGGNWYCQAVKAITYTGVGGAGSYNKVTNMDSSSGSCSSSPFDYRGTLSPLDEEVSMHIRGPTNLKQFAVYTPSSTSSKKSRRAEHKRRHLHNARGHAHAHAEAHEARHAAEEKRAVGDWVTAVIDGVAQSWRNEYGGAAATANGAAAAATPAAIANGLKNKAVSNSNDDNDDDSSSSSSSSASVPSGSWGRSAYYNAQDATSNGLTFLNHNGGSGSGVFDYTFGNSLSYASADGTSGASSARTLNDCLLPSSAEVVIMSDQVCQGDCGYVRPGTVAYHGFDGANKAFFFEFGMPDSGETAASQYDPVNMPAIWMLNAQIPNTLQYGNADCSCWTSGCGEFDIFEVLSPGSSKAKSTMHGNRAGGDSNYFDRPTSGTMKVATVLYNDNIHIKVLDSDYVFPESMTEDAIAQLAEETSVQNTLTSLFSLSNAAAGKA